MPWGRHPTGARRSLGIVAGVVDQDIGRQSVFALGTALVPEDAGERSVEFRHARAKCVEPGTEIDRIDGDHGLSHLAAHRLPLGVFWVVARQCAGGWKQAGIIPISPTPARPRVSASEWIGESSEHHGGPELRSDWREMRRSKR